MKHILTSCLLAMCAMTASAQQTPVYLDDTKPIEQRIDDALARMTLQEKIRVIHAQSKFSSAGIPRLGFPDFWTDDGPHGVRPDVLWDEWRQAGQSNDSCVAFPALTCLAATWNPSLSMLYGKSLGEEALYRGKDMILGPGVNINRTPLAGRNFEYMGEDPYLTSTMVVPYVQGLQSMGVSTCVKHYCLNNDEEYRHQVNVVVSDRALHEIYLPAFKAAVEQGKAWAIMGAYNLYKNEHNCHNQYTLNRILKGDWGFDGVVVSDWGGCHDTDQAVKNGLDMEFGTWTNGMSTNRSNAYDLYHLATPYIQGIKSGKYTTRELDDKVRRVLRLFYRTTMNRQRPHGFLCSESHYEAARQIANEGIVLLQNRNNVLPIDRNKAKRILIVGENAIKMMTVGGGSSSLKVQHEILPIDGLRAKFGNTAEIEYARGYVGDVTGEFDGVKTGQDLNDKRSAKALIAEAVEKAKNADYVIMIGGLNKAGYQDCEGHDRKQYGLPYEQDRLIEALAKVTDRLIYVNVSGNAVAMPWKNKVAAIVQSWFIGSEAGNAIADVLAGDANPSGKLPFTWYASLNDCGAHALKTYPGTWRNTNDKAAGSDKVIDEEYKEGIYVGYRWTEKHNIQPTFAFGHGLSYTTFSISNLRLSSKEMTRDGKLTFTVTVKNTGTRRGAETVQLYIKDIKPIIDRPVKELKGFKKVWLDAGEQQDVDITIDNSALAYYDEATSAWKSDNGEFEALIGNASDNTTLKGRFALK